MCTTLALWWIKVSYSTVLVEYYKTVQSQIHVHKVYGTQLWSVHVCQNMEGSNIFRLKTHKWNSPTSSWWVSKVRGQVRDSFPNFCNWCTWKHPTRFTELALSAAELHGTIFPLWKYAHFAPVVLGLASGYYKGRACRPPRRALQAGQRKQRVRNSLESMPSNIVLSEDHPSNSPQHCLWFVFYGENAGDRGQSIPNNSRHCP